MLISRILEIGRMSMAVSIGQMIMDLDGTVMDFGDTFTRMRTILRLSLESKEHRWPSGTAMELPLTIKRMTIYSSVAAVVNKAVASIDKYATAPQVHILAT